MRTNPESRGKRPKSSIRIVLVLVLAVSAAYRTYGSSTTATGTLTLPPPAPAPGDEAPTFSADRLGGGRFRLTDTGSYVVAFCGPRNLYSQRSEPYFRRLAEDIGDEDLRFVAVYVGGVHESARTAPYSVIEDDDGRLSGRYNIKRVPRLFVVEDGVVRLTYDGFSLEGFREVAGEIGKLGEAEAGGRAP